MNRWHVSGGCLSASSPFERSGKGTTTTGRYDTAPERFRYLLEVLHRESEQRVAVLVDEYDKPILDALETPETALANRDYLRGLYGMIKASDAHVRFTFVTGVSADLDTVFAPCTTPYDVLRLFDSRKLDAYWFETGTPCFLVETLYRRRVSSVTLGVQGDA